MPPAIQTGQKLMPVTPIRAPIATSAPQAGIKQRDEGQRFAERQHQHDRRGPALMVAHEVGQSARKIFHSLNAFPAPYAPAEPAGSQPEAEVRQPVA